MKKAILILAACLLALSLAGCKKTCKYEGCESEATKEGYCDYHYAITSVADGVQSIFNGLTK